MVLEQTRDNFLCFPLGQLQHTATLYSHTKSHQCPRGLLVTRTAKTQPVCQLLTSSKNVAVLNRMCLSSVNSKKFLFRRSWLELISFISVSSCSNFVYKWQSAVQLSVFCATFRDLCTWRYSTSRSIISWGWGASGEFNGSWTSRPAFSISLFKNPKQHTQ